MKTKLLILMIVMASVAHAQTIPFQRFDIQLNTTDSIDTYQWIRGEYPLEPIDIYIADKYTPIVCSEVRDYIIPEEVNDADIKEILEANINKAYFSSWDGILYHYKYYNIFRRKIRSMDFRNFLFKKGCDILCELVDFYPKDFQYKLLSKLESALEFLADMENHHYEIKENPAYSWKPLTIFVDGKANDEIAYTLEGFLLRRMYMDYIPYDEIVSRIETLGQKLSQVDNSENFDIMTAYVINNELAYCLTSMGFYFISLENGEYFLPYENDEDLFNCNVIKCRQNFGQNFYIITNRWWSTSQYRHYVIDKYTNVIHYE